MCDSPRKCVGCVGPERATDLDLATSGDVGAEQIGGMAIRAEGWRPEAKDLEVHVEIVESLTRTSAKQIDR